MPVSSNSLFHFTNSAENLFNILNNDFIPRYCLDIITLGEFDYEIAIPMVCFCNIPLSQIKKHIDIYGNYGIGLTRQWANQKRLNPVFYINKNSILSQSVKQILIPIIESQLTTKSQEYKSAVFDIQRCIKPNEGDFFKNGNLNENYRFYDEREWRYVPTGNYRHLWLKKIEYDNEVNRSEANIEIANYKLNFIPEDISYLIIKDESEIDSMIRSLRIIKTKYSDKVIEKLISRILTVEQIMGDF